MNREHLLQITSSNSLILGASSLGLQAEPEIYRRGAYRRFGAVQDRKGQVRVGVKPHLSRSVEYPTALAELVEINSDSSLTAKKRVHMDVRVVGASQCVGTEYYTVNSSMKVHGTWRELFNGRQKDIDFNEVRYSGELPTSERVDFAGRGCKGVSLSDCMRTTSESPNVVALINGDPVPLLFGAKGQADVESFLAQFIDENGNIALGSHDVIYLFDFDIYGNSGDALQDLVVLATFAAL
jgi:hypothetical protein